MGMPGGMVVASCGMKGLAVQDALHRGVEARRQGGRVSPLLGDIVHQFTGGVIGPGGQGRRQGLCECGFPGGEDKRGGSRGGRRGREGRAGTETQNEGQQRGDEGSKPGGGERRALWPDGGRYNIRFAEDHGPGLSQGSAMMVLSPLTSVPSYGLAPAIRSSRRA